MHSSFIVVAAGICFLVYGLSISSQALQKLAAPQIRKILNLVDNRPLMGLLAGTSLTVMMQSSGAFMATLVNLGSAGVFKLTQVMGMIIGSSLGAALTVQIISMHVSEWGLILFIVGFLFSYTPRFRKFSLVFEFVMALGLLFYGLELISTGSKDIVHSPQVSSSLLFFRENPWALFAATAILTGFVQSSTAMIGILMGLAASGGIRLEESLYWIYGAHIGTTSTALFAAINANYVGRQIAWANLVYRVASVALVLPFGAVIIEFLSVSFTSSHTQIAVFYTFMNLLCGLLFLPMKDIGVKLIQWWVQPRESEREFGVRFLKRSSYESLPLGLAHARRETMEMGEYILKMIEVSFKMLKKDDLSLRAQVKELDDKIDLLLREIKMFLIRVSDLAAEGLNQQILDLIAFGTDLEWAADMIDHNLVNLAQKKARLAIDFGPEAWTELELFNVRVSEGISLAMATFQTEDLELVRKITDFKHDLRDLERKFREQHLARLGKGTSESMILSSIYLEVLSSYLQIIEILSKHAYRVKIHFRAKSESGGDSRG